jgi:hypothetical protein
MSDAQLSAELVRRRMPRELRPLETYELLAEEMGQLAGEVLLGALPPEDSAPKPCPKCGGPVPVKTRDRERTVRSLAGPVAFKRNQHSCLACAFGFYPVDRMLDLPEEGRRHR